MLRRGAAGGATLKGATPPTPTPPASQIAALRALSGGVGLYFSAHWCGPCRGFTPELAKWYTKQTGAGGPLAGKLDIVFVSSDRSPSEFDEYRRTMPWKSLPGPGGKIKEKLSSLFKVRAGAARCSASAPARAPTAPRAPCAPAPAGRGHPHARVH